MPVCAKRAMTGQETIGFLGFAAVAALTPGPSNAMLAAAGAMGGFRRGLPTLLGIALGMASMIFVLGLGFAGVLLAHPAGLWAVKLAGAALLLWLAWAIATAEGQPDARPPVGLLLAALLQWGNPKSWVVSASAVATYLGPQASGPWRDAGELAALFLLGCLPSLSAWLWLGAALKTLLRDRSAARRFNRLMGLCLAASVILIFL
jgi:threonine/homoserine/homoserine lactone efflux protein